MESPSISFFLYLGLEEGNILTRNKLKTQRAVGLLPFSCVWIGGEIGDSFGKNWQYGNSLLQYGVAADVI